MRRAAAIIALLLSACCCAVDPSLLMRTQTDPSRMRFAQGRTAMYHATAWLKGGETAFTHVAWLRRRETRWQGGVTAHEFQSFFTVVPARATREGGDELPAIRETAATPSTSGGTFANPNYETHGLADWQYGCYAVNIETAVPLTLVIAGTERQVAPSNVVQAFNVKGSSADWSWSVAGESAATVRFGFGVNPLAEFYGVSCIGSEMQDLFGAAVPVGGLIADLTNEWTMVVSRARIEGGNLLYAIDALRWDGETWHEGEATKPAPAAAFARDARTAFCTYSTAGGGATDGTPYLWDEYGIKLFGRWLADDEVRTVRDLDMFEMRRRGMTRWASEEIVQ